MLLLPILFAPAFAHAANCAADYQKIFAPSRAEQSEEDFLTWIEAGNHQKLSPTEALAAYQQWQRKLSYIHENANGIRLAPPGFRKTFDQLSPSREAYQQKLNSYYTDKKVYRGMTLQEIPSNEELLDFFVRSSDATVGMGMKPVNSRETYLKIFRNFNAALTKDPESVKQVAIDHTKAEGKYWNSKYSSFSEDAMVAKSFARGNLMSLDDLVATKGSIEMAVRERRVAAIKTDSPTQMLGPLTKFQGEKEILLLGAADPESVEIMLFKELNVDPELIKITGKLGQGDSKRTFSIQRTGFNRIMAIEVISPPGKPTQNTMTSTIYQINADRTLTKVNE